MKWLQRITHLWFNLKCICKSSYKHDYILNSSPSSQKSTPSALVLFGWSGQSYSPGRATLRPKKFCRLENMKDILKTSLYAQKKVLVVIIALILCAYKFSSSSSTTVTSVRKEVLTLRQLIYQFAKGAHTRRRQRFRWSPRFGWDEFILILI